jgi:hypothetical protein
MLFSRRCGNTAAVGVVKIEEVARRERFAEEETLAE